MCDGVTTTQQPDVSRKVGELVPTNGPGVRKGTDLGIS
jgi:hypothetical protein